MRAWLTLREAGVEFDEEVVDIRRPQRFANLDRIRGFSPPGMVPVLVIEDAVIFDSLAIMEFANDFADGRLLPSDRLARAQARALASWQHAGLSKTCSSISFESAFYPYKRRLTQTELAECGRFFAWLEPILDKFGGPFLFGETSLADFALAPTVIRLARHEAEVERWPLVARWCASVLAHPHVATWMAEADTLPPIWYDDYLAPGGEQALYEDVRVTISGRHS